jgi:hypothetical protein
MPHTVDSPDPVIPDLAESHRLLACPAERASRNRGVLGLHYPSDTEAGRVLAECTFNVINSCPNIQRLFQAATREWSKVV